jgi:hypothetical protein
MNWVRRFPWASVCRRRVPVAEFYERSYVPSIFIQVECFLPCDVGPCHHGMARPQVADRGTASDMEGSCE